MLIDSHAHLNFKDYSTDLDEVILRMQEAGVEKVVNIGTSMADAEQVIDLAKKYDWCFAALGIHPNDDQTVTVENTDWAKFERLLRDPSTPSTSLRTSPLGINKVVAIGECGLDYSRIQYSVSSIELGPQAKPRTASSAYSDEKERQKKLFKKQIEIAQKLNLPLSIHLRDAQEDLMNEFGESLRDLSGVFHCFSGDQKYLGFVLGLDNFYVSFAGNITFKNAQPLRDLAKDVPLDRLLVETDCPFLTPEPNRGKRNEPANVKYTAETLASIKGLSFEEIGKITTENAKRLFQI